ncbi:hypothetical protein Bca101_076350 [Brassica carinata]
MESSSTIARKTWELENNILTVKLPADSSSDNIFHYDGAAHAKGKTDGDTIIVMDAFALPVEGTETRVNAQADAFMAGRLENVVGWYHLHPGTVSAGKVEIGAFRTYPEGHKISDDHVSEYQTIPLNKIEDFGVHCKQYYSLDITYFKSSLDSHLLELLWNKYWVNTLSSSRVLGNGDYIAGQISDLAGKLDQAESQLVQSWFGGKKASLHKKKRYNQHIIRVHRLVNFDVSIRQLLVANSLRLLPRDELPLAKITRDSAKITVEQVHGLMSQVIKDILFSSARQSDKTPSDQTDPEPMITS